MDGIDVLYHIGEIKNVSRADASMNVELVRAMLERAARTGLRRFVFISSISVAGIPSNLPATEETETALSLRDQYTESKRRCEQILRGESSGLEGVVIRPAPVYGPGSPHMVRLVRMIDKLGPIGIPFVGNARNLMPLIHVMDLADAIVLAGTASAAAGQTFNLTDGADHSLLDFFKATGDALGRTVRIIPVPPLLLRLGAAPLGLLTSLVGYDLDPYRFVDYFSRDLRFSSRKAESLLGWKPRRSLTKGAQEMVKEVREYKE